MSFKYIFFIILGLAAGWLLVRGGAAAVLGAALPVLKFALPLVAAYFGIKFLRAGLRKLTQGEPQQNSRPHDAIDICPTCGEVMTPRHVCRQSPS